MTNEELILTGDRVNVFWENVQAVFSAEVLQTPAGPGEVWVLKERNGTVHYVMTFSRMSKERIKPKPVLPEGFHNQEDDYNL